MTDNEAAKLHVRHMVGGRAQALERREVLYRFEFPERPGALMRFLDGVSAKTGTSQCPATATTAPTSDACWPRSKCRRRSPTSFEAFLAGLDYRFQLDENNDAYHRFLTHDSQRLLPSGTIAGLGRCGRRRDASGLARTHAKPARLRVAWLTSLSRRASQTPRLSRCARFVSEGATVLRRVGSGSGNSSNPIAAATGRGPGGPHTSRTR